MATDPGDRLLWAKYLDWCSAQIAERFLELTPEEIYKLAHEASSEVMEGGVGPSLSSTLETFDVVERGSTSEMSARSRTPQQEASGSRQEASGSRQEAPGSQQGAPGSEERASDAEQAASGSDGRRSGPEGARPAGAGADDLSYRALVERVTEALMERMELPPFDEWRTVYEADPERYEAELLGFWTEWG